MRYPGWEEYPFPLSDGSLLWLRVPGATITEADAERLCEYVRTLVVEDPSPIERAEASGL